MPIQYFLYLIPLFLCDNSLMPTLIQFIIIIENPFLGQHSLLDNAFYWFSAPADFSKVYLAPPVMPLHSEAPLRCASPFRNITYTRQADFASGQILNFSAWRAKILLFCG